MKKGIQRGLSIFAALALVFSVMLTGCGKAKTENGGDSEKEKVTVDADGREMIGNLYKTGLPIVKEKATLSVAAQKRQDVKHFSDLKFFKDMEEKTNVSIKWDITQNEGWEEKKNLIMASGDLPDAFYGMWVLKDNELLKYGSQGMIIPLEGLIEKYAPNLNNFLNENPDYKKALIAPDGHIYGLPGIDESSPSTTEALFINKKWLDKVGVDVPTTTEDFYKALKAFKGKDLNGNGKDDEIPMTFRFNDGNRGIYSLFGSFGLLDNRVDYVEHVAVKDGKVIFTANQPQYKEAIKYFNKLFSEGLIDQEAFTQDTKVIGAKMKSKDPILGAFVAWSLGSAVGKGNTDYVPLSPLKGPNGEQAWNKRGGGLRSKAAFVITSKCKNPEIAMRWANEMYEPKTAIQAFHGLFDVAIKENPNGTIEYMPIPEGKTQDQLRHQEAPGVSSIHFKTKAMVEKFIKNPADMEKQNLDKIYEPFHPKESYPAVFYTLEEGEKVATLQTDIVQYVNEMYAKWMLKGGIDSEWDAYVKKLNDMGLPELVKIYQAAYDRYKSAK